MQLKTHLALALGAALYFLPHINEKFLFIVVTVASTLIPNFALLISSNKNFQSKSLEPHPNISLFLRTYTLCIILTIVLTFVLPKLSLPFFIGYSFALFLETFSTQGIIPFWPYNKKVAGKIAHGGSIDKTIFLLLLIFDAALMVKMFL